MPLIKVVKFQKKAESSFKNTVDYVLGAKHKEGTVLLSGTRNLYSLNTAAREMEIIAAKGSRRSNPIWHCVISFRPGDTVSPEQVEECIDIVTSAMGFQNNQMVYALHEGKQKHIHIVANKVDPDTWRVISPRKDDGRYFDILEKAGLEIDRRQNRQPVEHGLWTLNEHKEIIENPDKFRENHTALSTRARDVEAHRGIKSLETIAKERVGDILHVAISDKKSWAWIHETLASRGVRIERHGKGLKFWLDSEHVVKGSRVDKKATLAILEKNLGAFQPREANVSVVEIPVKVEPLTLTKDVTYKMQLENFTKVGHEVEHKLATPVSRRTVLEAPLTEVSSETKIVQDKYGQDGHEQITFSAPESKLEITPSKSETENQNREIIHDEDESKTQQNKSFDKLKKEQGKEWHDLLASQKREREELRQQDWNGHWAEYYQLRSVLAAEQAGAKQDLREQQRRKKILFFAAGNDIREQIYTEKMDIRGYQPKVFRRCVEYHRIGKTDKVDFVDYGRQISINKDYDEPSILAAMQLAAQKWGRIRIYGDERYRQLCVKVAAENNFKLANEDLAAQVDKIKTQRAESRTHAREKITNQREPVKVATPSASHEIQEVSQVSRVPVTEMADVTETRTSKGHEQATEAIKEMSKTLQPSPVLKPKFLVWSKDRKNRSLFSKALSTARSFWSNEDKVGEVLYEHYIGDLKKYPEAAENMKNFYAKWETRCIKAGITLDDNCTLEIWNRMKVLWQETKTEVDNLNQTSPIDEVSSFVSKSETPVKATEGSTSKFQSKNTEVLSTQTQQPVQGIQRKNIPVQQVHEVSIESEEQGQAVPAYVPKFGEIVTYKSNDGFDGRIGKVVETTDKGVQLQSGTMSFFCEYSKGQIRLASEQEQQRFQAPRKSPQRSVHRSQSNNWRR